jgi:periplasmic divalent cation tolerance protein
MKEPPTATLGSPTTDCVVVLVTVATHQDGERIAEVVVGEQLAACVNIVGPIRSIYRWEDAVQRDEEWLLVIKTLAVRFEALAARVRALHSYTTPEVLALPVLAGSDAYLDWIRGAVRGMNMPH